MESALRRPTGNGLTVTILSPTTAATTLSPVRIEAGQDSSIGNSVSAASRWTTTAPAETGAGRVGPPSGAAKSIATEPSASRYAPEKATSPLRSASPATFTSRGVGACA